MKPEDIDQIQMEELIHKAVDSGEIRIVVQLLAQAYKDYVELAYLATDGNYTEQWTHKQVLSYFTTEGNV
jgi:hypothetical protein